MGLLSGAALSATLGFVAAPGAMGQSQGAGVGNTGNASANSGGNAGVGNGSANAAADGAAQTPPPTTQPALLGGLIGIAVNLGTTGSTSTGNSNVTTGTATATGNQASTGVDQSSTGSGGPFSTGVQSADVSNSGSASANTGSNSSVGNNSANSATNTQTVSGGLINIGLNLATVGNTSSGNSNIQTGPAAAEGNVAQTGVAQTQQDLDHRVFGPPLFGPGFGHGFGHGPAAVIRNPFGIGGFDRCASPFGGGQFANVSNAGSASANTGNNSSVGNQSQNVASNNQTIVGGDGSVPLGPVGNLVGGLDLGALVNGLGLGGILGGFVNSIDLTQVGGLLQGNLLGGSLLNVGINIPTVSNVSDGNSNITTGPAAATGNQSSTSITQECVELVAQRPPVINPTIAHKIARAPGGQLARTGIDPFVLGLVAFVLLYGGLMLLVWDKVEGTPTIRRLA
jgi:hypothetical protein